MYIKTTVKWYNVEYIISIANNKNTRIVLSEVIYASSEEQVTSRMSVAMKYTIEQVFKGAKLVTTTITAKG